MLHYSQEKVDRALGIQSKPSKLIVFLEGRGWPILACVTLMFCLIVIVLH